MSLQVAPLHLVEIEAYDASLGTTRTLRYANRGYVTSASATPANTFYDERVKQPITLGRSAFGAGRTSGPSDIELGELVLNNGDGLLDDLNELSFDGRTLTVRTATKFNPSYPSDFTSLVLTIDSAEMTIDECRFRVRDLKARLRLPFQKVTFAGTNVLPDGLEGTAADLQGKVKPVVFGVVKNIAPPCVNTSKLIYQVHDAAVTSIDAVYDRGAPITNGVRNWTSQTTGFGGSSINAAVYGAASLGEVYIIAGASGKLSTSTNSGVTWTARTSGFGATAIRGLAFGNDRFVAVGDAGTLSISTDAGVTWSVQTSGFGATNINGVAFGNGLFVAVGDAAKLFTSPDGVTWTSRTSGFTASNIKGVAYGARMFVAVGAVSKIASSSDGLTWTLQATAATAVGSTYNAVVFGTVGFIAVGNGGQLALAAEGTNWSVLADGSTTFSQLGNVALVAITYGNGLYIATVPTSGIANTAVGYSEDGKNWTLIYQFSSVTPAAITYGNQLFLMASTTGTAYASYGTTVYANAADLQDDTKAPPLGTYGVYLGNGSLGASEGSYFRLGGTPDGIVTADVTEGATAADRTGGQLFKRIFDRLNAS